MSKDFIISISSILAIFGLIFVFQDSLKPWFQYVFSHTYIIAIIFDFILLGTLIHAKYKLGMKQNIFAALTILTLVIGTTMLAYLYASHNLVQINIFIVAGYASYVARKAKKITSARSQY